MCPLRSNLVFHLAAAYDVKANGGISPYMKPVKLFAFGKILDTLKLDSTLLI